MKSPSDKLEFNRDLWGGRGLPVAGQHFEGHGAAAVLQQLLQFLGVSAHRVAINLQDDVAHMQQALPGDGTAVQDPPDHRRTPLHAERHTLGGGGVIII